jgi:N-acetylmuramoyl-L-alanine amidase
LRQNSSSWQQQTPEPFLWTLIRNNVPLVVFLLLAAGGMVGTYWFYASPEEGIAEAVAAASAGESLSAVIYKEVPSRPVEQRFVQTPGPLHVAIIAGHMNHDSGAVCADGLTEADVNLKVAHNVAAALQERDIPVDIFAEFDPRLQGYTGTALISIHADSCDYINDLATGFKISGSSRTDSSQLSLCMEGEYQRATGLPYHANTITDDMRDYHAFREIAPGVPAVIIELGFMNLDRELLTTNAQIPSDGVTAGILCFLEARRAVAAGNTTP